MKQFILGTAGHVDHGKSSLIRALTEVDTDRLPEEKERGLSIDLGFAPLRLSQNGDEIHLGVVDVPGHRRFLRNMIAGVGGFDGAVLVVDPQEGVKPQTREHLKILELLNTPRGLVVLTKADRCDEDTLELARWDVAELLEGSFLEGVPMVVTSAETGAGLDDLRRELFDLFEPAQPRAMEGVARLPVDRAFSKTGFGTVITGSLWSGQLEVGQELEILPSGEAAKVRGLQVHGESVERAVAGQRVAVNLSGTFKSQPGRGSTLVAPPSTLTAGERYAVSLSLSGPSPKLLKRKFKATFYQATGHHLVTVNLVADKESDLEVFGQLQFPESTLLVAGDRFLLRDQTDRELIGGGTVLALEEKPFRRRDKKKWLARYKALAGGGEVGTVLQVLQEKGGFLKEAALRKALGSSPQEWENLRTSLLESGRLRLVGKDKFWDDALYQGLEQKLSALLTRLQTAAPWKPGWRPEELASLLGERTGQGLVDLMEDLVKSQRLQRVGPLYSLAGHQPSLSADHQALADKLLDTLKADNFSPRDWSQAMAEVTGGDKKTEQVLDEHLLGTAQVVKLSEKVMICPSTLEAARQSIRTHSKGEAFSASEARQWLETSRKFIIPILEWMDQQGWTHRAGDQRMMT